MGEAEGGLLEDAVDLARRRRPGVVAGVLDAGERTVRAGGDLRADSLVEIGSVTKVFTATLLAEAVVRGEVRLDTPVRDLLPPGATVPSRDGAAVTLAHLATHRSGLPRSPAGVGVLSGSWEMLRGRNPYAGLDEGDLLAGLAGTRLRRRPGSGRPRYSNAGFGLLGLALARAAGTTYDELVAERVCAPLGLRDTVTPATATAGHRARWARGHRGSRRGADDWVLDGIAGAGALRSTVPDLLVFLAAHLDPAGSPLEAAIRLVRDAPGTGGAPALGWQRHDRQPALWWHNGGTGGFRSFVGFVPERGRAVAVVTDSTRGVDLTALRLLRDLEGRAAGPGR